MKKIALILLLVMVTLFSAEAHKFKNRNAPMTISIQTFYNELSPYGDWIYTPDYGFAWRPYFNNPEAFRPYSSNGNWIYTQFGWTWVSNYVWGWATFHYGRWNFDNYLGWMWIPGSEWAPAWVTWGSFDNLWGWAPMGPNINVHFNAVWLAPDPWWTFVPRNHFCSGNWNNFIYNRPVNVTNITNITNIYIANNYSPANHNTWYEGPRVSEVERYYGRTIRTMEVVENQSPENAGIRNNKLNVYRPSVDNRRSDARPTQYRNVEQARRGSVSLSTNPRVNNPGENQRRENRIDTRSTSQLPAQPASTANIQNRAEKHATSPSPANRSNDASIESRETKVTPRGTARSENRTGTDNRGSNTEQSPGSRVAPERNSSRPTVEPKKETSVREVNIAETEKNRSTQSQSRSGNSETRQTRNSTPLRENVNNSTSHERGNKPATDVQPSRRQDMQNVAAPSDQRTENTNRKQATREEVKQADQRTSGKGSDKRASQNPARR